MPIHLTHKQKLLLRTAGMAAIIYLAFKYLIPLILPFLIAGLLSIPIRPVARILYKWLHIPMGMAAGLVLAVFVGALGVGCFYLGRMAVDQLLQLAEQLPGLWESGCNWVRDCCGQMENLLHLSRGALTAPVDQMIRGNGRMGSQATEWMSDLTERVLGDSLQGALAVVKGMISLLVTVLVTIGATLITTTQLQELKNAMERSVFRQEIRLVVDTLARVGTAYGKTQLVIMLCTTIISAAGLTILGDPYAFLWAVVIGLVDALPIFGAGTILWPWLLIAALRGQLVQTVGLAVIYILCNLVRQWLEARYMGDRIGLTALENLIAMYLGLQLFGILGLFFGPIGYLLVKEAQRFDGAQGNPGTEVDKI